MANTNAVSVELLRRLRDAGALMVESHPDGKGGQLRLVDLKLGEIAHRDARLRREIALSFFEVIGRAYFIRAPQRLPIPFGIIGVTVGIEPIITTLSNLASHTTDHPVPIPAATTKIRQGEKRMRIYGHPVAGHKYALIDDISKTGDTIIAALRFWLEYGYDIDRIVVFTDRGAGGFERIAEETRSIREEYRRASDIEVTCLVTPAHIIEALAA